MPAAAPSNQWTGKTTETPEVQPAYLVLVGGVYRFSETGPSTAALVYDSGTNALQIDTDPDAAGALTLERTESGRILYY